ncbi:unnamed protein product [Cladocopium goreaui]|uniref:SET domain-containing protein 5 n=1 Tax=Cladocopium goreaui TaxID=2562237 RepID=A0A9P1G309_9DINO|nr:unnamed protein product [Cladocopium goreaui]
MLGQSFMGTAPSAPIFVDLSWRPGVDRGSRPLWLWQKLSGEPPNRAPATRVCGLPIAVASLFLEGLQRTRCCKCARKGKAFEIVEVEGSGLGAVACKDFHPGELVLTEEPLCKFESSDASLRMVERKCANLPDDLRKKVLSLEDSFSFDTKTFRGILETNGMVCESGSDSDPKALFLEVSRFNHSCNANCDYSWRDRQNCMDIYAQTIIRAGEELCIPYIDLREPRQVRQQLLKENWRFRCRCEVCCLKDFSESDRRRLRLGELSALLYSSRTSGRTLRIAKKLLKLYNDEHISAQSYKLEACKFGYRASLDLNDNEIAPRFAQLGLKSAMICHGPEHEETQEWVDIMSMWD